MKIKLQGISIIKDSEIELNGLTVITGANNSGKTTVGKVIYSLFDAVSDLPDEAETYPCLIDYTKEGISQTLKAEFAEQIQPVKADAKNSSIVISDANRTIFKINIVNNEITDNGKPIYFGYAFRKVFFIDNPFVLNSLNDDISQSTLNRTYRHDVRLSHILKGLTTNILEKQCSKIMAKINEVVSGDFVFSKNCSYYVDKGCKLPISNMSAGLKMFSILKLLLSSGVLTNSTILILDEPEVHLHPAWQNKFAEILVMLVKELNVKVLLTSHSPNFVLAIDAFMRKYEINDKTNFYQTKIVDGGFAEYVNVDNDMGRIYADFVQCLTEVKQLRNKYAFDLGEDIN